MKITLIPHLCSLFGVFLSCQPTHDSFWLWSDNWTIIVCFISLNSFILYCLSVCRCIECVVCDLPANHVQHFTQWSHTGTASSPYHRCNWHPVICSWIINFTLVVYCKQAATTYSTATTTMVMITAAATVAFVFWHSDGRKNVKEKAESKITIRTNILR